jgi:hypothetical protein
MPPARRIRILMPSLVARLEGNWNIGRVRFPCGLDTPLDWQLKIEN